MNYSPLRNALDIVWGPPTPLMLALEAEWQEHVDSLRRTMSTFLYGNHGIHVPWRPSQSQLRMRTLYGGKKGRAAIKRLKRMGARPITTG